MSSTLAAPGTRCLKLAYINRAAVTDAKRKIMRYRGIETEGVFCDLCEKWHLRCETWPPIKRWRDILILLARGYRHREIAKTLGTSKQHIDTAVHNMCADWRALSQTQLITICTSFGIIDPSEFMLLDDELAKFRPRDSRKVEYSDAV